MPKEKPHTVILKAQRTQMKEKGKKYAPGTASLQVLGSGARGAPRSLYLFTDQSRYLFNCGEGTQRLAHEHKMKLSRLEHIFITGSSWENLGGLPGVALTIQDVGVPEITLHGPQGIDSLFAATRRFVVLRDLSIKMADCRAGDCFEDNALTVKYVPLLVKQKMGEARTVEQTTPLLETKGEEMEDEVDYYAHERPPAKRKRLENSGGELNGVNTEIQQGGPFSRMGMAMAYVVRLKERPGALSVERCAALGVPPGPLLGRLKNGLDVTLPDGTVVKSSDVTSPPQPGPLFVVVECPSEDYLDSLESDESLKEVMGTAEGCREEDWAFLVAHFTPPSVMANPRYVRWMESFRESTHHLILNESNTCLGSLAVHRIQTKLNLIDPEVFPPLKGDGIEGSMQTSEVWEGSEKTMKDLEILSQSLSILPGRTLATIGLRPKTIIDRSPRLKLETKDWEAEVKGLPGWGEVARELPPPPPSPSPLPSITFLGTGSCIPNKTRNTSAILLDISPESCIILDCGEGSFGQLVRFGSSVSTLRRLKGVFVSHLHADHHMGLVGLLKGRRAALEGGSGPPLFLLAPAQISVWLRFYHNRFEPVLDDVTLIPNDSLLLSCAGNGTSKEEAGRWREEVGSRLGVREVATARAKHCPNSFGVAITLQDGWKIAYSGDTMPCPEIVQLGRGCDVLIHEATMEDDLLEEAEMKMHSTVSQALGAAREAGASSAILTHFSQRYAKLPRVKGRMGRETGLDVGLAFDNMTVRKCDLERLPHFYPALRLMFQEDYEELEQRALKRKYKMERLQKASPQLTSPTPS